MLKSVNDGFEWMVSFTNLEKKPDVTKRGYRLDKMFYLLELFDNPQLSYKTIHVAGSKGKGSTSAFLASILNESGFKTGIYSSPHLLDYRERITNNHNFFPGHLYLESIKEVKKTIESLDFTEISGGKPTTFELMTLVAFIIFKKAKCDWVVVETGLGGRLDSTNTVLPQASVITTIELEHTEILGSTIQEIAFEKSGIIKQNRPIFTSTKNNAVLSVIKKKVKEMDSKLYTLPKNYSTNVNKMGTILNYEGKEYKLGLEGEVQGENALLAITTLKTILPELDSKAIDRGIEKTSIPGRFHQVANNPITILDGAHTIKSVKSATDTFKKKFTRGTVIFGVISGKEILQMAEIISKEFENIIISTPGTFKKSNLNEIEAAFTSHGTTLTRIPNPKKAYNYAKKLKQPILVTGSFYMAGEIAKIISKKKKSVVNFRKLFIIQTYGYIGLIPFIIAIKPLINHHTPLDLGIYISGVTLILTLLIINQLAPYIKVTPLRIILFTIDRNKPIILQRKNLMNIERINKNLTKLSFVDKNYEIKLGAKQMNMFIALLKEKN